MGSQFPSRLSGATLLTKAAKMFKMKGPLLEPVSQALGLSSKGRENKDSGEKGRNPR